MGGNPVIWAPFYLLLLTFNQTKTFRDVGLSTINLLEQTYKLIPTENKRVLVYSDNLLVNTKPFTIDHDKII